MNDQNFNQESYTPPVVEPVNPFPPRPRLDLRAAFGSGLFLALCILMTVLAAFGSFSININEGEFQTSYSFNIIAVLVTIGMWITFASARGTELQLKKTGLVMVSGSIKALRILGWVGAIALIVCGVLLIACALAAPQATFQELAAEIPVAIEQSGLEQMLADAFGHDFTDIYLSDIDWATVIPLVLIVLSIFFLLVAVIIMILIVTFYKKLHQFARSLCDCVDDPDALPTASGTVSVWLLVLGILNIFSGLTGVIMIVGYAFLKKYFVDVEA